MSDIEHWIGVRMAAGYDDEDFRDLMRTVNTMRSVAEAVVVESAEVPQPQTAVEALQRIRDHGQTRDEPCLALHRGDCADVMQEIARAALRADG